MRPPATSGARVDHGQPRRSASATGAAPRKRAKSAAKPRRGVSLPKIKAFSRGETPAPRRSGSTGAPRAARPAPSRSSAVNRGYRGGATPAVREYLGEFRDADVRASRPAARSASDDRRVSPRTSSKRRSPGRTKAPGPAARAVRPERDRAEATRRQSLRALENDLSRGRAAGVRNAASSSSPRMTSGAGPYGGRAVASAGGAAALTVGKAMVDVARPAAAAAKPMLRVVTGGLERLPAGQGAQAAARGRILIVIAGLLAAGLIYINVGKLEAGDGYGRYAQRSLELQRENTIVRSKVAALESSDRIARVAKKLGMVMPQPEQFKYLRTRDGDPVKAIRTYTAPTPVAEQPVAVQPQAQGAPTTTAPDTGAASPVTPQPTTPQPQQPAAAPGATTPGAAAPGAAAPGAGTGAPAVGGN